MEDYVKLHKSGAVVIMNRPAYPNGMFRVTLRIGTGPVIDEVRCDTYRQALDYRRAFNAIAKNYGNS